MSNAGANGRRRGVPAKRFLLALCAVAPAAAQQATPPAPAPVILRPSPVVVAPPRPLEVDPTQLQLAALRQDLATVKDELASAHQQLIDLRAQLNFSTGVVAALRTRFETHVHRVNGEVGQGFSTVASGDGIPFSYMMPIRNADAQLKARETGPPLPLP